MKLNWAERWVVNNPMRVIQQNVMIRWMHNAAPRRSYANVLEVGCGRGAGARAILHEFQVPHVCAMDLDSGMVAMAGRYLREEELRKVSLHAADLIHLPYRDHSFDAVFGFGVIHHVPRWEAAVAEIARVLREGGTYFLEELYPALYQNFITKHILLHPRENRFHSTDLRDALARNGLSIVAAVENRHVGILAVSTRGESLMSSLAD
jgi:ubiquinone/menaquinone biosynthesis C-methylase UbiE